MTTGQFIIVAVAAILILRLIFARYRKARIETASDPSVRIGTYKVIGLVDSRTMLLDNKKTLRLDFVDLRAEGEEGAYRHLTKETLGRKVRIEPTRILDGTQHGIAVTHEDGMDLIEDLLVMGFGRPSPDAPEPYASM